jgi:dynein heavy chain
MIKWEPVDSNVIDDQCKAFGKETRALPKPTRAWNAFLGLDQAMKTFASLMPLVTQLRSPLMRDLELHKVADDVNDIVEKAGKELVIEKFLRDLAGIWDQMMINFMVHAREGINILGSLEDLINQLEENQVQVANNMAQKHIARFLADLQTWQTKLSVMDQVITIWNEVQTTWTNLENIFVGSADIRQQLAEDSERFNVLNKDWIKLMKEPVKVPNAVECCNREGR